MRLYHKYHRQKNPRRRAALRGERAELHAILMGSLTGSRKNPNGKSYIKTTAQAIDAFNLLGAINAEIDAGARGLIPLRDTVSAHIDGYLSRDVLDYNLSEALADLSRAEIKALKKAIESAAGKPPMVQYVGARKARAELGREPEVRRARGRVASAERAAEAHAQAVRQRLLSPTEFQVGPERIAQMKAAERAAEGEVGKVFVYRPADPGLWDRAERIVKVQYPGYIPPVRTLISIDIELFRRLTDLRTSRADKRRIKERIEANQVIRRRNFVLKEYEHLGGRELSEAEARMREAQRMKALGTPFALQPGFFGVITAAAGRYKWKLFDVDKVTYMEGVSGSKVAASKDVNIAMEVVTGLIEDPGWDNLEEKRRRWLVNNKPKLSTRVARMLMMQIGEKRGIKVTPELMRWILSAAELRKEKGKEDMATECKNMTVGEERVFRGQKGRYEIHVKRHRGSKWAFQVVTKGGNRSAIFRTGECSEVMRKGHMLGGAMTGGEEVAKTVSNPSKLKRMENGARKYFRAKNPKMPREPAKGGEIEELIGIIAIPEDPEEAYRYGYYAGIVKGIDTCGVQHYMTRRKLRKQFQKSLIEAEREERRRLTERVTKRGRSETLF